MVHLQNDAVDVEASLPSLRLSVGSYVRSIDYGSELNSSFLLEFMLLAAFAAREI